MKSDHAVPNFAFNAVFTAPSEYVAGRALEAIQQQQRQQQERQPRGANGHDTPSRMPPSSPPPPPMYLLHPTVADDKFSREWARIHCPTSHVTSDLKRLQSGGLETVFAFVGRLNPNKGPTIFLHAAAALLDSLQPTSGSVRFVVVGSGVLEEDLRMLAAKLRIEVTFYNYTDNDLLPCLLRKVDAFVFTSLWNEPFGMVNIEAQLMGLPLVVTNVGGVEEYCSHQHTCLVADLDTKVTQTIAQHMRTLHRNPKERRALGMRAEGIARERFSGGRQGAHAAGIYLDLLRKSGISI